MATPAVCCKDYRRDRDGVGVTLYFHSTVFIIYLYGTAGNDPSGQLWQRMKTNVHEYLQGEGTGKGYYQEGRSGADSEL